MTRLACAMAMAFLVAGAAVWGKGAALFKSQEEEETSADYAGASLRHGIESLYGMNGKAIDVEEAMSRFLNSAKVGDPLAVYYEAVMVGDGWGCTPPDPVRARRLLDRAYLQLRTDAADGHIEALYAIAEITASGRMAPANPEDARRAFEMCIKENYPGGLRELGRIELNAGRPAQAVDLLRRAVVSGDATASWLLSRALLQQGDIEGGRAALLTAARLNHPLALGEVARRSTDPREQRQYLERAARAGDARSQYEWALAMREEGNFDNFVLWLEVAVSYGYVPAYMELARLPLRRNSEIERMLLAQWAAEAGVEEGRAAMVDYDYETGLALPVWYSTRRKIIGPANYAWLDRDIHRTIDLYLGGREEEAQQELDELVRVKGATLPASLAWYSFYSRGAPLAWLAARPETLDALGRATAAGLAGQAVQQHRYAAALDEEASRQEGRRAAVGRMLATVLDAHAYALEDNREEQWRRLGELDCRDDIDTRVALVNFINHFTPALRREPDRLAAMLGCDPGEIAKDIPVIAQDFD